MNRLRNKHSGAAFTLIEMVIVLVIGLIMMSLVLPAVNSLMKNNKEKAAMRTVRSMLTLAQSRAAANHRNTGVRFQFDYDSENPNDPDRWRLGTQYMVIVEDLELNPGLVPLYQTYPDTRPIALPQGVAVLNADIDATAPDLWLDDSADKACLMDAFTFTVVFAPDGSLKQIANFAVIENSSNDALINLTVNQPLLLRDGEGTMPPRHWLYNSSGGIDEVSATGFYITELEAMNTLNPVQRWSDYIADLPPYLINIYTGQFLPRDE